MKWGSPWNHEKYRLMEDDEWKRWFAWYPVTVDYGVWTWLEEVEYNQPMSYYIPHYRSMSHED